MCWRCERADTAGLQTSYSRWNRSRGGAARESPVVDWGLGSDSGMGTRKDSPVRRPSHFLKAISGNLGQCLARGTSPLASRLDTRGGVVVAARPPESCRLPTGDCVVFPDGCLEGLVGSPSFTFPEGNTGNLGQGAARGTSPLASRLATRGGVVVAAGPPESCRLSIGDWVVIPGWVALRYSSGSRPSDFAKAIREVSGWNWPV